jgi:hypothetical protein
MSDQDLFETVDDADLADEALDRIGGQRLLGSLGTMKPRYK